MSHSYDHDHNHGHGHHHHHHGINSTGSRLLITMVMNFIITIVQIVGGIISGSLSLISDALHNFSDGVSVILSYIAIKLKGRKNSERHTFGLKRAEILAAVINSSVLVVIALYLFYESALRFFEPTEIDSNVMTIVAAIGLIPNIIGAVLLKRDSAESMNIKSSYLHLVSDSVFSVAVILGGLAITYWQVYWIDPLLTVFIGIYIIRESYFIIKDATHILMEGAPDISVEEIEKEVLKIKKVQNIHHIHMWMVGENDIHIEAHVNVSDMLISKSSGILEKVEKVMKDKFKINHVTLQFECGKCAETELIEQHK